MTYARFRRDLIAMGFNIQPIIANRFEFKKLPTIHNRDEFQCHMFEASDSHEHNLILCTKEGVIFLSPSIDFEFRDDDETF